MQPILFKVLLCLACSSLAWPAGAQKPSPAAAKPRGTVDITAQLQAQAIAAAAAVTANKSTGKPLAAWPAHELPDLERAIAQRIHQGHLPCELGATIRVEADLDRPGYFNVQGKGFQYRMYPVRSQSGALRLEDAKAGAVWLQLANKSMLMDEKKGRRIADECVHPEQVAYAQRIQSNPPPDLFDKTGQARTND